MSTTVDLSVYAAWLRGPDISQNIQQRFKKYPKIDCRAFAFNRRRYTADNRLDLFGLSKFKGGNAPLPPHTNIPEKSAIWTALHGLHAVRRTDAIWTGSVRNFSARWQLWAVESLLVIEGMQVGRVCSSSYRRRQGVLAYYSRMRSIPLHQGNHSGESLHDKWACHRMTLTYVSRSSFNKKMHNCD